MLYNLHDGCVCVRDSALFVLCSNCLHASDAHAEIIAGGKCVLVGIYLHSSPALDETPYQRNIIHSRVPLNLSNLGLCRAR